MSNSPAFDAAALCITAGVLAASGSTWPAKVGRLTTSPDAQAAFIDTPGQRPNPKYLLDFPTFQVLVRGAPDGYDTAYAKGKAIKDALLGMNATTLGTGDRWDGVTMLSDLAFLAYDETSRPLFSLNFRVILEPATNALTSRDPL